MPKREQHLVGADPLDHVNFTSMLLCKHRAADKFISAESLNVTGAVESLLGLREKVMKDTLCSTLFAGYCKIATDLI